MISGDYDSINSYAGGIFSNVHLKFYIIKVYLINQWEPENKLIGAQKL